MGILFKVVLVISVVASISAVNEDENLIKMFAQERKEMREEQKEMRAVFQRENAELRAQNDKLSQEMSKLHKKLHDQNQKLHKKLRRADIESKRANRQRNEKESQELEAKIHNAIRQERHSSESKNMVESVVKKSMSSGGNDSLETELKKLINAEIKHFLLEEKICVAGSQFVNGKGRKYTTIQYGYTFMRKPALSVSVSRFYDGGGSFAYVDIKVKSSQISSAVIETYAQDGASADCTFSWIACL